jgi:hypothetical protein
VSRLRGYELEVDDGFVAVSVEEELDEDSGVEVFGAGSDAAGLASDDAPDSAGLVSEELPDDFDA